MNKHRDVYKHTVTHKQLVGATITSPGTRKRTRTATWWCLLCDTQDMFHSDHSAALLHARARAASGGPVVVSDEPGCHDALLLRRLVLPDGSVLRVRASLSPLCSLAIVFLQASLVVWMGETVASAGCGCGLGAERYLMKVLPDRRACRRDQQLIRCSATCCGTGTASGRSGT